LGEGRGFEEKGNGIRRKETGWEKGREESGVGEGG